MKIQHTIRKSAVFTLWAASLAAAASAQLTPGSGKNPLGPGNLANDLRPSPTVTTGAGQGASFAGKVKNAGSIFVDLGADESLVLSVEGLAPVATNPMGVIAPREHKKLRLAGGTPGNAGAILVNLRAPATKSGHLAANSAMISARFGASGSFVVDLPDLADEVFVQGFEATPIGGAYS